MTDAKNIVPTIRHQLKSLSDPQTKKIAGRFFKEPMLCYGVASAKVQALAKETWKEIKTLDKQTIFQICEELFRSDYSEEAYIAGERSYRCKEQFQPEDFTTFASWIAKYINTRAKCDTLCNHTVGEFIDQYPQCIPELKKRTDSDNRRMRRAAAVTFIIPGRQGRFLEDILRIAERLLMDPDDMVQKGYGRMLKAASQAHQQDVFEFVMKHKDKMPRTALRYAIEKMPQALKAEAMKKAGNNNF